MSKKNIVEALDGIRAQLAGESTGTPASTGAGSASGSSGNSGLGFTLVYYDPSNEQNTSLMAVKNGNLVPFTVTDLGGYSVQDAIKTVPILLLPPANGNPLFICNMARIAQRSGMTMLGFSGPDGGDEVVFIANSETNYAFVPPVDSDGEDGDGDAPPR